MLLAEMEKTAGTKGFMWGWVGVSRSSVLGETCI